MRPMATCSHCQGCEEKQPRRRYPIWALPDLERRHLPALLAAVCCLYEGNWPLAQPSSGLIGRPEHVATVLPAILAGGWDDSREGDRQILAALAGATYEDFLSGLMR